MLSILCVVLCEPRDQLLRTSGSVSDCLPPRGRNDGVHKYEGVKLSCSLRLLIISSGWNLNLDTVFHLSATLAYMYVGVHCTNESTSLVALTAVSSSGPLTLFRVWLSNDMLADSMRCWENTNCCVNYTENQCGKVKIPKKLKALVKPPLDFSKTTC